MVLVAPKQEHLGILSEIIIYCLFCIFIGVLVVFMVLIFVVFDSVGLIIVCLHSFDKIYLMSCLYCKWSLKMMDEDQWNKKEMANTMIKINKKAKKMFNIVHVRNFRINILK